METNHETQFEIYIQPFPGIIHNIQRVLLPDRQTMRGDSRHEDEH